MNQMDNSKPSINNFKASDGLKELISSLPPGIAENLQNPALGRHVDKTRKIAKKLDPPPSSKTPKGPVATSTKQSMGYVTVANIESETSYQRVDWPIFVLKELQDNAYDWFNAFYPATTIADKDKRKIAVRIWITTEKEEQGYSLKFVHIAVRNSNVNKYPVFGDLKEIFDFTMWQSTKRYQHGMTCGSLGDFLKRGLGMGYALFYECNNPKQLKNEEVQEAQWTEPIILRFSGYEYKAFIKVDRPVQTIWSEIERQEKPTADIGSDTEVEVTLPILVDHYSDWSWVHRLKQYYKNYKIGKTRTAFSLDFKEEEMN